MISYWRKNKKWFAASRQRTDRRSVITFIDPSNGFRAPRAKGVFLVHALLFHQKIWWRKRCEAMKSPFNSIPSAAAPFWGTTIGPAWLRCVCIEYCRFVALCGCAARKMNANSDWLPPLLFARRAKGGFTVEIASFDAVYVFRRFSSMISMGRVRRRSERRCGPDQISEWRLWIMPIRICKTRPNRLRFQSKQVTRSGPKFYHLAPNPRFCPKQLLHTPPWSAVGALRVFRFPFGLSDR